MGVAALVLGIIAAVINMIGKHPDWVTWLLIAAVILASAEVTLMWRRGGYYHRGP